MSPLGKITPISFTLAPVPASTTPGPCHTPQAALLHPFPGGHREGCYLSRPLPWSHPHEGTSRRSVCRSCCSPGYKALNHHTLG